MSDWSLTKLFGAVDSDIERTLGAVREVIAHPGAKGDASEQAWLDLLNKFLPRRYEARRAIIVDSRDHASDQIDIVVHDRHYSPFVFSYGGVDVVPSESVYAVFEAKQSLNAGQIEYAHKKIASVRALHRTSQPIPTALGTAGPRELYRILGGVLALDSDWSPPFGKSLRDALRKASTEQQIDLGCIAGRGSFELVGTEYEFDESPRPSVRFLLGLIARLQTLATAPMIDIKAYAAWIKK